MDTKSFKKGEIIIEEGSLSNDDYIIEIGSVEASKRLPAGKIQVINKLDKKDIIGEIGLIDQLTRSATVKALEDCRTSIMIPDIFNSLEKKISRHLCQSKRCCLKD